MIRKLESLEVKDGKIILKVRAKAGTPTGCDQEGSQSRSSSPENGVPTVETPEKAEAPKVEPRDTTQGASSARPNVTTKNPVDDALFPARGTVMICTFRSVMTLIFSDGTDLIWADRAACRGRGRTAPPKVASVEGITEYRLDNGLQVLSSPTRSRPKVTVNLTVLVGSRHEGYGETGMAHLLEHMVFKGTPTHPNIPGAMKERGAAIQRST